MQASKRGFSLVELSIVIIIIGLLAAAVTGGLALQKAARIQAVISDLGKFKQNAVQYKEKYYYWPGDQVDTFKFWNTADSMGAACIDNSANTTTNGCNGDGNNAIGGAGSYSGCSSSAGSICQYGESYRATQALAASGFITGKYSGTGISAFQKAPVDATTGMNLASPVYVFTYTTLGSFNKNVVSITDITTTYLQAGALRPDAALAIDQKIDDKSPVTGFVRGFDGSGSTCITSNAYGVANNSTYRCILSLSLD